MVRKYPYWLLYQLCRRESTQRDWKEHSKFKVSSESFTIDTARLWTKVNPNIKAAQTLGSAKNLIKNYCKTLEI